ncbi:hypothetical protein ACXEH2_005021 [Klebsiella pneumoniae]
MEHDTKKIKEIRSRMHTDLLAVENKNTLARLFKEKHFLSDSQIALFYLAEHHNFNLMEINQFELDEMTDYVAGRRLVYLKKN